MGCAVSVPVFRREGGDERVRDRLGNEHDADYNSRGYVFEQVLFPFSPKVGRKPRHDRDYFGDRPGRSDNLFQGTQHLRNLARNFSERTGVGLRCLRKQTLQVCLMQGLDSRILTRTRRLIANPSAQLIAGRTIERRGTLNGHEGQHYRKPHHMPHPFHDDVHCMSSGAISLRPCAQLP
jgi:hypothetical protein